MKYEREDKQSVLKTRPGKMFYLIHLPGGRKPAWPAGRDSWQVYQLSDLISNNEYKRKVNDIDHIFIAKKKY